MNIQDSITALLNGEMTGESELAELMHRLAVSPEKRALLVEQIRMSRAYRALGSSTTPTSAADAAVFSGLAAIDRGFASAAAMEPPVVQAESAGAGWPLRSGIAAMVAVALLCIGVAGGLLLGSNAPEPRPAAAVSDGDAAGLVMLGIAQDSLTRARMEIAMLRENARTLHARIERLSALSLRQKALLATRRQASRAPVAAAVTVASTHAELRSMAVRSRPAVAANDSRAELPTVQPVGLREAPLHGFDAAPIRARAAAPRVGELDLGEVGGTPLGVEVELRNNLRLSLPRVYGLSTSPTIFADRELQASLHLARSSFLSSSLRGGIAVGETEFSQVLTPSTDGRTTDSLVRQSPRLLYARGFLAPEVLRIANFSTALELGVGGTQIGPLGTIGVQTEYHANQWLSATAGVSAWMLWTSLDGQIYTSTNLNIHYGIGIGF